MYRRYEYDTVIIGSGCAGFNAADWLHRLGHRNIAMITEGLNMGTSRNTGSDKQTYYKLSLAGEPDSVGQMARTLYGGKSVNGDTALTEAACSVKCFMKLCNLGVDFPTNEYGEYVGYMTDHDPVGRGTSAGPLTSKYMTERLQKQVCANGTSIYDGMTAIKLLTENSRVYGVVAIDSSRVPDDDYGLTVFVCDNVIMATGGPAGIYYDSVYPESQTGMTGMALEAGALGANLQEWQYGLASLNPRWNVSGTYQQALPRYIAVDKNGNEREFLPEYFKDPYEALNMVFLKGYQWPFDVQKIGRIGEQSGCIGSSLVDLIVYHETIVKGNRVYMDYRNDPVGIERVGDLDHLSSECVEYLKKSGALMLKPIDRLAAMNPKAVDLYKQKGIDLYSEFLEIGVCAQHNNGGLKVDVNWETSIRGLYAAGECAGTFGVYRPGGSALNSAQVGGMRAAEHIAGHSKSGSTAVRTEHPCDGDPGQVRCVEQAMEAAECLKDEFDRLSRGDSNVLIRREEAQRLMSRHCAHIRVLDEIDRLMEDLAGRIDNWRRDTVIANNADVVMAVKNRDMLITQYAVAASIKISGENAGSRGSGLIVRESAEWDDLAGGEIHINEDLAYESKILIAAYGQKPMNYYEDARPIPERSLWFEEVWNSNRR